MAAQANEAQSAIDVLRAENERLSGVVTKLTSERDKAGGSYDSLAKEYADFKKVAGDPEAHKARVSELEQKLRTVTHKAEFTKLAKAALAHDDAIDDLFALSGYVPTKDEVDPKALKELVDSLKEKKGYAFAAEAAAETTSAGRVSETITPGVKPIPGAGRGTSHDPGKTGIKLTKAQLSDPKFMLDPKNKEIIKSAAQGGRLAI